MNHDLDDQALYTSKNSSMRFDDIPQPEDQVSLAALEVAKAYCSPSLLNHSVRSYLWAAAYGRLHRIAFDVELLYVSALLHDLGLVIPFDSHTLPFEEAGGHVARVFGAGAGWPSARCERAAEIIVRHMRADVDPQTDAEGHLLQVATTLDISGRGLEKWPTELRLEVLDRLPRFVLGEEFLRCFEDQASRKPDSSAATAVRNGIAGRITANPLDATAPHPTA